jgi:hypothetical protein
MRMKRYALPLGLVIALLCLAGWTVHARRQSTPRVMWEYKIIEAHDNHSAEKQLNQLGAQGWEVVGIVPVMNEGRSYGGGVYHLKRAR